MASFLSAAEKSRLREQLGEKWGDVSWAFEKAELSHVTMTNTFSKMQAEKEAERVNSGGFVSFSCLGVLRGICACVCDTYSYGAQNKYFINWSSVS